MEFCFQCERELTHDEIGLHKKMINRGAETFLCIDCLSRFTGLKIETLRGKIEQFRKMGCTLFMPLPSQIQETTEKEKL